MSQWWNRIWAGLSAIALCLFLTACAGAPPPQPPSQPASPPATVPTAPTLLSDPFLQSPTPDSVRVVWFTEFEGRDPTLVLGQPGETSINAATQRQQSATSSLLSRTYEDRNSFVNGQTLENILYPRPQRRPIWRHEAIANNLTPGERTPYRVEITADSGDAIASSTLTLAPAPNPGQPLNILLTSDHQLMPMTAANLQKVKETVGDIDAVFAAGDSINIPDRASEWFDDDRGGAFFPCLQGRASYSLERDNTPATTYTGGELIQNAPLFPAIANHEVMGRFNPAQRLNAQFNDPVPRAVAERRYEFHREVVNPQDDPAIAAEWVKNQSFNSDTYEEIFSLPTNSAGHSRYYATTFGDVRLVVLYATTIWRSPALSDSTRGRFRERAADLEAPERWGYGNHIFEPIARGSKQYQWLERELASSEFQQARYKIVMLHHPMHTLGDNIMPPYTDPVQAIARNPDGSIQSVRYDYPRAENYLIRDVEPLLEEAGVNLVYFGHSHLWNRFISAAGTHYLESSNVGNTYGAYIGDTKRQVPSDRPGLYAATGDPNGLTPVIPTESPLKDEEGATLPYLSSNTLTAFSIFNSASGVVSSYYFDTDRPDSEVVEFDRFSLTP
ncbi:MAG: metallophosphoesterase [Cyanobacteria bacterium J06639_1]